MDSEWVYVDDLDMQTPPFHTEQLVQSMGSASIYTRCGRSVSFKQGAFRMPRRWAESFGKPCATCFAEEVEEE